MTAGPQPGQVWQHRDKGAEHRKALVLAVDEHWVVVQGSRRSRVRAVDFPRRYRLTAPAGVS